MVVAGRMLPDGDVAIMIVEAESTTSTIGMLADSSSGAVAPTEETVPEGLKAAKPFLKLLCEAQQQIADQQASRRRAPRVRGLPAGQRPTSTPSPGRSPTSWPGC